MKRAFLLVFFGLVLLVGLAAMVIKPVPTLPENELAVVSGEVEHIYETNGFDIFFKLDNGSRFYINRGTELGLNVDELRSDLVGKIITIKYPEVKTVFGTKSRHLSKIEYKGETIFSELD